MRIMNKKTVFGCTLLILLVIFLVGFLLSEQQKQIAARQMERDDQMMGRLADATYRASTSVTTPQQIEKLSEVGFRPHIEAQKSQKDV